MELQSKNSKLTQGNKKSYSDYVKIMKPKRKKGKSSPCISQATILIVILILILGLSAWFFMYSKQPNTEEYQQNFWFHEDVQSKDTLYYLRQYADKNKYIIRDLVNEYEEIAKKLKIPLHLKYQEEVTYHFKNFLKEQYVFQKKTVNFHYFLKFYILTLNIFYSHPDKYGGAPIPDWIQEITPRVNRLFDDVKRILPKKEN